MDVRAQRCVLPGAEDRVAADCLLDAGQRGGRGQRNVPQHKTSAAHIGKESLNALTILLISQQNPGRILLGEGGQIQRDTGIRRPFGFPMDALRNLLPPGAALSQNDGGFTPGCQRLSL